MASSMDEQLVPEATVGVGTVGGKHRILAELKRLEQELKYLQARFIGNDTIIVKRVRRDRRETRLVCYPLDAHKLKLWIFCLEVSKC
ncbi:uncharacterized protein LOC111811176 isoform X2 [Cucurbita pepo subsp. pepo]|uniref:uncharacterized protein LOC111811176 isoform X2 n=1 Tax=Cucurbita pepo subsp. pepo TaxID=3664 RepID=UPI000C9D7626|nr:uncharacterized protein LOC111811176 isoform X2 [Cucurbita pepo subsp. pepo]